MTAWTDEPDGLSLDSDWHWHFFSDGYAVLWLQLLFDKFKFATLLGVVESVGTDLLKTPGQDVL